MESTAPKKRVLLVDDDPIALRIYRDGLIRLGFEVKTGTDGLSALQALRATRPDIVVLDLMMPRFSGVEVLKFIRGEKQFEALPVIVLSNAYMDQMAQDAAVLGAQKGLLKIKCNPGSLAAAINEVLAGLPAHQSLDNLLAAAKVPDPAAPPTAVNPPAPVYGTAPTPPAPTPRAPQAPASDPQEQARRELSGNAHALARNLRQLFEAFIAARGNKDGELRLQDLYRKIHFVTAIAGIAEYHAIAQMASALEALLFNVMDQTPPLEPSVEHTTSAALYFLQDLLTSPPELRPASRPHPLVLVVDDDRVSNRLVISALRNAQLQARGTESPEIALQWLREKHYDLILLDIEMPGMNGIDLCKRLRVMPGYAKTPVIYVTLHSDFETRTRTIASGGNDLIGKPILPTELAVKALMHLLKSQR
jgi:CheY-like chemotaxis protein